MKPLDADLRFLKEASAQLQDYLLSNELYWPLSASLPRLTPGALLLIQVRCQVSQPLESRNYSDQVEVIRIKWRAAWEKKALREISNRLRLWSEYLSDFVKSPDQSLESYRTEVRGRVILQLLLADQPDLPEKKALADLDIVLQKYLIAGDFIWESESQPAFPQSEYWFLYGNL